MNNTEEKMRYSNISGTPEEIKPGSSSMNSESKLQNSSSSNLVVNSQNESSPNCLKNQGDSYNSQKIHNFFKNSNQPFTNSKNPKIIEIVRDANNKEFFIKAKNHDLYFYKVNKDTKIKDVIENYIQKENLEDNIINNFYYNEKRIENLENTIDELEINTLGIITTK